MSERICIMCPTCGTDFGEDTWDALSEGEIHKLTCHVCGTPFYACMFECEACVADNITASIDEDACLGRICKECGYCPDTAGDNNEEPYF